MTTRRADIIGVLEAGYRLDGTDEEWLQGIAAAAASQFEEQIAVTASVCHLVSGAGLSVDAGACCGPPGYFEAMWAATMKIDPALLARLHLAGPCNTLRAVLGESTADDMLGMPEAQPVVDMGVHDLMGLTGFDPTGHGACLSVALRRRESVSPAVRARWSRVIAHLVAAHRARRAVAAATTTAILDSSEAVLTPAGQITHARGDANGQAARQALTRAARAVDAARSRLRGSDPDAALDLWLGLFAGRWSLVDVFDSDGRRFVVARRNDANATPRLGLSPREFLVLAYRAQAHSLKLIAYETGLSIGTISGHLRSACMKLGVRDRVDLATLFGGPA